MRLLRATDYEAALAAHPSPKAKNAPRHQEVLLLDFAAPTQAMVKVRVRIDALQYLDYLSYHRIDGTWLITAKSFHLEHHYAPAALAGSQGALGTPRRARCIGVPLLARIARKVDRASSHEGIVAAAAAGTMQLGECGADRP